MGWEGEGGGWERRGDRHFGVAVATWRSYEATSCQGEIHGAMAAFSSHGSPTGALQRHHSFIHDITGSANALQKADHLTLSNKGIVHE